MSNKFCRYLTNGYSFSINGISEVNVKPCCWFKSSVPLKNLFLRSDQFENIDSWTSRCINCQKQEESGHRSLRQAGFDWIDDVDHQDPVTIDIKLHNICNAACVICNEHSSSLWIKEKTKLGLPVESRLYNIKNQIQQIVDSVNLAKLRYVKFFGGEPMLTTTHLDFIKHIPHPEQVVLHYTTNGSILPNEQVLAAWSKFKLIIFAVSIDGIEQQFDYLRWPLSWTKVSGNLFKLRDQKIHNLMFRIEFTANFLNVYDFDRLEQWKNNNFSTNAFGDEVELNIHSCFGTTWILEKMPESLREKVKNKYSSDHTIYNLVKNLSAPQCLSDWKNFVKVWDSKRNISWQAVFPNLVIE